MSNKATAILLTFPLNSFASYCCAQTTPLLEYAAQYEANANGLATTATRSLSKIDESSYRLSNSLEASIAGQALANLEQVSGFIIDGKRVVPLDYS